PRMNEIGDNCLDKITDLVISATDLNENTLIFQHSFGKPCNKQRLHYNKTVNADLIDISSRFFAKVYNIYVRIKYRIQINELSNRIISVYGSDSLNKNLIEESLAIFLISAKLYAPLFRRMKPKNVFIVSREVFKFALYLGHKNKCKVFEFQHGITQSESA